MRFETGDAASLLVKGNDGRIISGRTSLEVERAAPTGFDIFLDGSAGPLGVVSSGENWIKVAVPAGSHGFERIVRWRLPRVSWRRRECGKCISRGTPRTTPA